MNSLCVAWNERSAELPVAGVAPLFLQCAPSMRTEAAHTDALERSITFKIMKYVDGDLASRSNVGPEGVGRELPRAMPTHIG